MHIRIEIKIHIHDTGRSKCLKVDFLHSCSRMRSLPLANLTFLSKTKMEPSIHFNLNPCSSIECKKMFALIIIKWLPAGTKASSRQLALVQPEMITQTSCFLEFFAKTPLSTRCQRSPYLATCSNFTHQPSCIRALGS